jgi:hypothetical protein
VSVDVGVEALKLLPDVNKSLATPGRFSSELHSPGPGVPTVTRPCISIRRAREGDATRIGAGVRDA